MPKLKYLFLPIIPFTISGVRFLINISITPQEFIEATSTFALSVIISALLGLFGEGFKNLFNKRNIKNIKKIVFIYLIISLIYWVILISNNSLTNIIIFYTISGSITLLSRTLFLSLSKTNESFLSSQFYTIQLGLRYFSIIFSQNSILINLLSSANLLIMIIQFKKLSKEVILKNRNKNNLKPNLEISKQTKKEYKLFNIYIFTISLYAINKFVEYSDKIYCNFSNCSEDLMSKIRIVSIVIAIFTISFDYINSYIRSGGDLINREKNTTYISLISLILCISALIFVYFKLGNTYDLIFYIFVTALGLINAISYSLFIFQITNNQVQRKNLIILAFISCFSLIPLFFTNFPYLVPTLVLLMTNLLFFILPKRKI